jgi:hypothetical protein
LSPYAQGRGVPLTKSQILASPLLTTTPHQIKGETP